MQARNLKLHCDVVPGLLTRAGEEQGIKVANARYVYYSYYSLLVSLNPGRCEVTVF